jgi:hypothetical protein
MKIDISKLSTDDISKIVNNYYKKSVEESIYKNVQVYTMSILYELWI